jgi:hypothetical protein
VRAGFHLDAIAIAADEKIIDPTGEHHENMCDEEGIDALHRISDCLFRSCVW